MRTYKKASLVAIILLVGVVFVPHGRSELQSSSNDRTTNFAGETMNPAPPIQEPTVPANTVPSTDPNAVPDNPPIEPTNPSVAAPEDGITSEPGGSAVSNPASNSTSSNSPTTTITSR